MRDALKHGEVSAAFIQKKTESKVRGCEIRPVSVVADTGRIVAGFPEEGRRVEL